MIEVTVDRLGLDKSSNSFVVVLREKHGTRLLPIWIGRPEAESIATQMNHIKLERPMTHDLCQALVQALGGTISRVAISRIKERTYFAELHVEGHDGPAQIDARPSDSIALALRFQAPIFADESLLAEFDDDDDDRDNDDDSDDLEEHEDQPMFIKPIHEGMSADQLKAYLAKLRPEDFGKFTP
jgi:bifunctional DNase/RNase